MALVLPEKSPATAAAEQSGDGIAFRESAGFEAYLARIGGEDGFNLAIYKAICSYVGSNGAAAGTPRRRADLKARLKAAIEAAPSGNRSQADIDRYASDAYLDNEINRVLARKEQEQPEPSPPHYPTDPLSLDEAKTLLNRTVADWVGHAVTHSDGVKARQVGVRGAAGTGKTSVTRDVLAAFPADRGSAHRYLRAPAPACR